MAVGAHLAKRSPIIRTFRNTLAWSLLWYLRLFARLAIRVHRPIIIGIAGAVGKSTAKLALSAILTSYQPTLTVDGNSETGVPLGILGLSHGQYGMFDWIKAIVLAPMRINNLRSYRFLIIEYGIDGPNPPKNMAYLLTIVKPTVAIMLNESPAHVGNYITILSSHEQSLPIADQLDRIVTYMTNDDGQLLNSPDLTAGIVNADDPRVYDFATHHLPRGKIFTVGEASKHDVSVVHSEVTFEGSRFIFAVHSHQIKDSLELFFPALALPAETGTVLAAAILTAIHLEVPLETISTNLLQHFSLPPGRGTILAGIHDSTILDSSYNASSASVLSFLRVLKLLRSPRKPTLFLFGDMKELGEFADYEHGLVAKELPGIVDHVLLVGNLTKQYVLPYINKHKDKFKTIMWFESVNEAGQYLKEFVPSQAILLVKGSQNLEEAIKSVLQHPDDRHKLCRQDAFWEGAKRKRGLWSAS